MENNHRREGRSDILTEEKWKVTAGLSTRPGAVAERDGVSFGYYASGEGVPSVILYKKGTEEIAAELPFPDACAAGGFYHMKVKFRPASYEYNFRDGGRIVTDPYARLIVGRGAFGSPPPESEHGIRGGFLHKPYDWEGDVHPDLPYSDAVMYHLHVRGFTKQKNSGVRKKGTFAGIREKLPYLKALGVNQLKLMPAYEFAEVTVAAARTGARAPQSQSEATAHAADLPGGQMRMNYWGYGAGYYFAPKASYAAGADVDTEVKDLVKAAHKLGMEVLMEFCFTEDADILMIGECLNFWAEEYHIDGFSVIARDGIAAELARLPLFHRVKLICGWYPEQTVRENARRVALKRSAESKTGMAADRSQSGAPADLQRAAAGRRTAAPARLAESNDGFLVDCRRLLKADEDSLGNFAGRVRRNPEGCAVINYVTNHDGFTLADLVAYEHKQNAANQEQGRDGSDYNFSWNCGVEGPTKKREILRLRMQQRKNALAMLLFAQGTPMLLAGDEFGNSQLGNNNPYCHDSELSWLDWSQARSNRELTEFVRSAVAYRKAHKVLHQERELQCADSRADGCPDLSYHGERAWYCEFDRLNRHMGCLYSASYAGETGYLYIAYNLYWTGQELALPLLSGQQGWYKVMDTSQRQSFLDTPEELGRVKSFRVPPRTILILEGREHESSKEADHMAKDKGTF